VGRAVAEPGPPRRRGIVQPLFYAVCKAALRSVFRTLLPVAVRGRANVPSAGGVLIVANHQSYIDPPLVGAWLPRQFHSLAREGLFRSRRLAWLIRGLNAIPVHEGGEPDAAALRRAVELLRDGRIVLVFPEGTRTETGAVGVFQRGVTLLIKRAGTPVLPVAVAGAFEAWPRGRRRPRLFARLGVIYGEPIAAEDLLADGAEAALERLRSEVIRLKDELSAEMAQSR